MGIIDTARGFKKLFDIASALGATQIAETPKQDGKATPLYGIVSTADSYLYKAYQTKPYNPDVLISKRGGLDVYDDMLLDDQVKAVLKIKKTAILSPGWTIEPVKGQEEIAEFVKNEFLNIKGGFEQALEEILTSLDYGYSLTEKVFVLRPDSRAGLDELLTRAPHAFYIHTDNIGKVSMLEQVTASRGNIPVPYDKFIHYVNDRRFGNPYGTSDLRAAYRPYFSKTVIEKFWLMYLERFGQPIVRGSYNNSHSQPMIDELNKIIDHIQTASAFTLDETMKVELIEAVKNGTDGYERCVNRQNSAIARSMLCPELLGFTDINQGSYALGKKHFDVFAITAQRERNCLADNAVNAQLVKPLVDFNFSVTEYPKFKFNMPTEDQKDVMLKLFLAAVNNGTVIPTEDDSKYFRKQVGFPENPSGKPMEVKKPPQAWPGEEFAQSKKSTWMQRVDFAQIEKGLDDKELAIKKELYDTIRKIQNNVENQIIKDGVIDDADMKAVRDLNIKYTGDLRQSLKEGLRDIVKQGFKDVRVEIGTGKKTFAGKTHEQLLAETWITPKEAVKFIEEKSFMLAGIESDYIKKNVQMILANGIKAGKGNKEIMSDIGQFFDQYDYEVSGGRLETIVRTNSTEAYNLGRLSSMRDPDLEGFVEAVEFSAIIDDRTTDYCSAQDGRIYAIDDPDMPPIPAHYSCRSLYIPVTELDNYKLSTHLAIKPAEGFYSQENHNHGAAGANTAPGKKKGVS